ncbi:hypothetical protein EW145_g5922 [Phellinidium pouzarii]|uniref:Uncharacterized protein n=1 Tax=Phellinidium pouzarii TaxID=167371 RepID=A0A4S4L331_9AGAM|nr:hypothetical protein EW145_g5922 [Phellinidium pouzarii]
MFLNPYKNSTVPAAFAKDLTWERRQIAELRFPVAFGYADISGNGFNDIILSDEYGPSMDDIWADGGRVSWFENTGDVNNTNWERRFIGKSPGMHRLRIGHFTTRDSIQIIAVPIVIESRNLSDPAPVIIYTAPNNPTRRIDSDNSEGWPHEVAFANSFRLVHEVIVIPSTDGGLDQVLLAGREGISLIWYEINAKEWRSENIGTGLPETKGNPYWGSASVYVKDKNAPASILAGIKWTRYVLEDFGPLNEKFTGSIHYVVCADIDGDGIDEILVALMGSDPPSWYRTGVWCYKPIDLENGKFARFKLSDDSAGRIAIADFRSCGYFESPNPSINAFLSSPITAEKLDDEVLFRFTRPPEGHLCDEVEFLDVSGRKLALVVIPPNKKYSVENGSGVKVISGRLTWNAQNGSCPPYSDMKKLTAHNIFPAHFPNAVRYMDFPWVKVEDRPWAHGGFKGLEFYNLIGFHVRYLGDFDENVCHIQLWTAGVGVSAGFHNHTDKSFCEIHACIVNGTGEGGMSWATVADEDFNPTNPDKAKYRGLIVPSMSEHGPLWRTDADGLPCIRGNETVDYPWHAWIAGEGNPYKQSFDVWVAFEFPSFIAKVQVAEEANHLKPGIYFIIDSSSRFPLSLKDGSSTNGIPVILEPWDGSENQRWECSVIPGTRVYKFKNLASGSAVTVAWPPAVNQSIIGSRSPARLDLTSAWTLKSAGPDLYEARLVSTNLVLSADRNDDAKARVTLNKGNSESIQSWLFKSATNFS